MKLDFIKEKLLGLCEFEVILKRFSRVIRLLDNLMPKDENSVVFYASPDFGDNAKALYDYIVENDINLYKKIYFMYGNKWWESNLARFPNLFKKPKNAKLCFVYKNSFWGLRVLLKAKTYIINETIFRDIGSIISNKHIIINLWHGMPIKTIGYLEKNVEDVVKRDYKFLGKNSYLFATSDIFKSLMSNSFMTVPEKVYVTGMPRNDCILENDKWEVFNKHLGLAKYSKVILYAPTYREMRRKNDVHQTFRNIFYCDDYDEKGVYEYLERNNILLIFKPHLFDEEFYDKNEVNVNFEHPNVKYVGDIFFKNTNTSLYELFKYTDLLISDFSSITVDYLISSKPVVYLLSSEEQYGNERGFSLEDNYTLFMPGYKAYSYKDMINCINDAFGEDSKKNERLNVLPLMHKYIDADSSKRIVEVLEDIKRNNVL